MTDHKAIENPENVCFNCLKEKDIIYGIHISEMGYGSEFEGISTEIHLCEDCLKQTNPKWWELEAFWQNEQSLVYKHEKEIMKFVRQMPIEGKELFYNRFNCGTNAEYKNAQDWIDARLGELEEGRKIEEYYYYSPEEIHAYQERFPICQHPVNRIFNDNLISCWCPFGARGMENQECGTEIYSKCCECEYFTERNTPIKDIQSEDFKDYEIYYKAKINADRYKEMFE